MRYILFILLQFYSIIAFAQLQILVKYSTNDCVFCKLALSNTMNLNGDIPVRIVLRDEKKADSELISSIKEITEDKASLTFSDSIYYALDSSERSRVYILDEDKVCYKEYLKTSDKKQINKVINEHRMGNIEFPKLSFTRQSDSFIYMGGECEYILRIRKDNPFKVYDTLFVGDKNLNKELYKITYGKKYLERMDSFKVWAKKSHLTSSFELSDFQVLDDTVWVMITILSTDKIRDTLFVGKNSYILVYYKNKCINRLLIDGSEYHEFKDLGRYGLTNHFFTINRGCFYISAYKDSVYDDVYMLAQCKIDSGKIKMDKIIPYSLPEIMIRTGIGFFMSAAESADGIFSNVFSDVLYDLNRNSQFVLPNSHLENNFNYQDAFDLTYKTNFMIRSLKLNKNNLQVIYQNGDSILNAHYNYTGKEFRFISKKVLFQPYPDKEKSYWTAFAIDKNLIYNYYPKKKKFIVFSASN